MTHVYNPVLILSLERARDLAVKCTNDELCAYAAAAGAASLAMYEACDLSGHVGLSHEGFTRICDRAREYGTIQDYLNTVYVERLRAAADRWHAQAEAEAAARGLSQPATHEIQYTPLGATSGVRAD